MKPSRLPSPTTLAWITSCLVWMAHGHALADNGVAQAGTSGPAATDATATQPWSALTPEQQKVLAPLAQQWHTLDDISQAKWLRVALRFEHMSPEKQARLQARMHHWAQLTPQQRAEARLRFQQTRQLSPDERRRKWEAYQALSPEDRQDLSRQAVRKAQPVFLPEGATGPREARQAYSDGRRAQAEGSAEKSNVVPSATPGSISNRTAVRPAIVNAGTGATTQLVNQQPTPPLHQQTGLPKITATPGFVDPVTLLPQKGAQGAAMTPPSQDRQGRQAGRE